jgi:hypothetical protein
MGVLSSHGVCGSASSLGEPSPFLAVIREFLTVNVLTAVQDADNHNALLIGAKIDTPLPVGKGPQAGVYPVAGRAGQAKFGKLVHLAHQIVYKTLRRYGVIQGDVGVNIGEVGLGRFRNL